MAIDFSLLTALAVPAVKSLFAEIVKRRTVRFGDLVKIDGNRERTKAVLEQLQKLSLVKESNSGVEDFNTYYVTADGLEASRKVGI